MPPPRASSAEISAPAQTAAQIAAQIEEFFADHPEAAVLEDGKVLFALAGPRSAQYTLNTEHERCTLHFWSEDRNLVRRVVSFAQRNDTLRLATLRFGHAQTKLLELVGTRERRTPTTRETARSRYVQVLERVLERQFAEWKPEGFRTAMDLERSFGPAYARGVLLRGNGVKGNQAWAVIGVNEQESAAVIDGVLTLGILWLHHCREQAGGRRLYQGLKVIVPHGMATLTLSRLVWLNPDAAQWELWELDQRAEELTARDPGDQGNLRTRLVHHPDEGAAAERFAAAIEQVMELVPAREAGRVEQRLRSPAELAFLLHGMEFARAKVGFAPNSFAHVLDITVGIGAQATPLSAANRAELAVHVTELFRRRRALAPGEASRQTSSSAGTGASSAFSTASSPRRIGAPTYAPAHSKLQLRARPGEGSAQQDPLYRAAPERWLESVLRRDLRPLTRSFGPAVSQAAQRANGQFANEPDPDTIGNRADPPVAYQETLAEHSRVIPRLDPEHVYAQVPAIAGASDRGLLDLLGVTADGRLAVIELKADDDLHFALQGLDYWIRVRQHHLQTADPATGLGEFQRHGYFRGVELSPLPPRLYLVAPALRIHPATETLLRYFSPRVEWNLLALDERWRQQIRVVWRKYGGGQ